LQDELIYYGDLNETQKTINIENSSFSCVTTIFRQYYGDLNETQKTINIGNRCIMAPKILSERIDEIRKRMDE
jgi:hypothetical protein